MSFCLVVQKDTLENQKVKSVVRSCENEPNEFLKELQGGHCIEYQLLAYADNSEDLISRVSGFIAPYKTNYGRDWYEFNHEALAKILTLFLESGISTINLSSISSIIGFSLQMFPVVNKEIKVSALTGSSTEKEEIITLLETLQVEKTDLNRRKKDKKVKKET